ncbi:unnamed protein product, partial [Owenia fusiformis]
MKLFVLVRVCYGKLMLTKGQLFLMHGSMCSMILYMYKAEAGENCHANFLWKILYKGRSRYSDKNVCFINVFLLKVTWYLLTGNDKTESDIFLNQDDLLTSSQFNYILFKNVQK